jgi:glyoxylate utilization-related uncharacterized protein
VGPFPTGGSILGNRRDDDSSALELTSKEIAVSIDSKDIAIDSNTDILQFSATS